MPRSDADPVDTPSVTTPSPDEKAAAERRPSASERTDPQRSANSGKVLLAPKWPCTRFVIPADKEGEENLVLVAEGTPVDPSRRDDIVRRAAAVRVTIHEVKA